MFFTTATAQADFAEVSDADGYVNLRAEANTQSRVITRIGNGAFVYLVPPEAEPPVGDWVFVQYRNSKNQVQDGWLHQSRLRNIAQFPTMSHQASSRGFPASISTRNCMWKWINLIMQPIKNTLAAKN
ncbi:Uncharacterised protein [Moraxella lacunata]|uniref:SH3b domain-containing protein n=1 Tax=Moraxella lacunata TaxID=477 RepID=A0A378QEL9_MORLA|nr:SH3 domain-containing protein [Moraxella lacunata]STY99275.1 Uncharacterised protein [Moraxella lacunata]